LISGAHISSSDLESRSAQTSALARLARCWADEHIRYRVLHGWQTLPAPPRTDIDLVLHPADWPQFVRSLQAVAEVLPVQSFQHQATCFYIVLAEQTAPTPRLLALDVAFDYRRDGHVFLRTDELLKGGDQWNGFLVAAPEVEFEYLLIKRVSKGDLSPPRLERLQQLAPVLGRARVEQLIRCRFGGRDAALLLSAVCDGSLADLSPLAAELKRGLIGEHVRRRRGDLAHYWWPEVRRTWRRWLAPTGLWVVTLGPDGAGKSTLNARLLNDVGSAFRRQLTSHARLRVFGRRSGSVITDPHARDSYPGWLSALKLAYYTLENWLAYLAWVRLALVRSTLMMSDRYFDDLRVDPRRYRYGGPGWLVSLFAKLQPRPDMYLVLDCPEDALLARKQELPRLELARQRAAYRHLAARLPGATLLDASQPMDDVAQQASSAVLRHLHSRYTRRMAKCLT
jgi:thymidylate kinase